MTGNEKLAEEYEMKSYDVNVLDKRRTLTEKLVSLIRCSVANDYVDQMSGKIRHFYDMHYLYQDAETIEYLNSESFSEDFMSLLKQDQERFEKPDGWRNKTISDSPLITDLHNTWLKLQPVYLQKLPDLAYKEIPSVDDVENSIKAILNHLQ